LKLVTSTGLMQTVLNRLHQAEERTSAPLKFYASGLPFCPRAFWLDHVLGPASGTSSYKGEASMDRGTAIHRTLQKWLGRAGVLYGNWSCPRCGATLYDTIGPPGFCPVHTGTELVYNEYKFYHEELSCRPDGLLRVKPTDPFVLLEIKSSNSWSWRKLEQPYNGHIEQCNAYACILRLRGWNITSCWVWYVDGGYPQGNPKIWEFKPNRRRFYHNLATMQKIRFLREHAASQPPPRTCTSQDSNPWCPLATFCWEDNLPTLINEAHRYDHPGKLRS